MGFLITLFILLIILAVVGAAFYFHSRKLMREQKNYERGLKMVPLLIHLPPLSDDIEAGSRDIRDVTDETISKAQVVYNIIASTAQKGFKSQFYGQRHFSFEIVRSDRSILNCFRSVQVRIVRSRAAPTRSNAVRATAFCKSTSLTVCPAFILPTCQVRKLSCMRASLAHRPSIQISRS